MTDIMDNTYLRKTALTSTKNKYLTSTPLASKKGFEYGDTSKGLFDFCSETSLKRESSFPLLENRYDMRPILEKNELISTENKFLLTYSTPRKKQKMKLVKRKLEAGLIQESSPVQYNLLITNEEYAAMDGHSLSTSANAYVEYAAMDGHSLSTSSNDSVDRSRGSPDMCFGAAAPKLRKECVREQSSVSRFASVPGKRACFMHMLMTPPKASMNIHQFNDFPIISQPRLLEMPVYNFDSNERFEMKNCKTFSLLDAEASSLQLDRIQHVKNRKIQLLNTASMALICTSNLKNANDLFRTVVHKYADDVRMLDPEFILKVALYSRQELHIRSVSNFLLSYAAFHEKTRPYLEKYFEACIRLPSDWIEVADLYEIFADERLKKRSIPSALKKVMKKTFSKFDVYQLAKYNRNGTKKKRSEKQSGKKKENIASSGVETMEEIASHMRGYSLKQLIRLLHLNSPAEEVMCLLGKKYPESAESFKKSGLSGVWDPKKSGQRMKLPTPETWESQISSFGNKAVIWERLIDHSKLPFMAMLRNLRNLLLSGISQQYHDKILMQLQNKGAVMNSRQLPLQFYEAFKIILEIEDILDDTSQPCSNKDSLNTSSQWKIRKVKKISKRIENVSKSLLDCYKNAVSNALEISALKNLQPIPGKSLVICDVLIPNKLGIKKKNKAQEQCIMMGLMCLRASEDCKMCLIFGNSTETVIFDENYPFLQTLTNLCSKYCKKCQESRKPVESSVNAMKNVLEYYLRQQTILKEKLDHVIYLNALGSVEGIEVRSMMSSFLHKYRHIVNPELLYTNVDLCGSNKSFTETDFGDNKDVYLCGNTTQLIKFMAERSTGGQLTYVENIDQKYKLPEVINYQRIKKSTEFPQREMLPIHLRVPKWHTVRIFISSTFKDMLCERDMLIRYVIPELRKRAASVFVKINEVDLRWGITGTDCASKCAAELCLLEAQKADLFIGILGDRYGTICDFEPPDSPDLRWVKGFPIGLSITELEMYAGALRKNLSDKKAYFYFRNSAFLSLVPEKFKSVFASENQESANKVEALKLKIISSRHKVMEGYPCHYAGQLNDKPILSGLDSFGKTVLEDLWGAIEEMHEKDPFVDDVVEEEIYQQHSLNSSDYFIATKNSPMDLLIKKIKKESGIFLISGSPGCGKTTFVVNMMKKLEHVAVIKFFVGLTPRSTDISYMLMYISNSISRQFPVSSTFPTLTSDVINHFPDILHEAVKSSGNSDFILVIDGLDHLLPDDQMLDWLPLNLPQGLRVICTASDSSFAFKVLSDRQMHGETIYIQNLHLLDQSDRESIVRSYLKLYGKELDESSFNNQMLHLVTKKDSGIPLYLRISCDFLRSYASFENCMSKLQSLPSTMPLVLQEIILQMENDYGSILVQTALTLLCITKEGLDDTDLHLMLSLMVAEKGNNASFVLKDMTEKILKFEPENFLTHVTYCSLVHTICTFAYGHNRFKKLNLSGSEFEEAVQRFYLNKNYSNFAKLMHCSLAAYYYTLCDPKNDGTWKGRSAAAFRGLIFHLFHGQCFKDMAEYFCCLKFLEIAFNVDAGNSLLEYYSLLLDHKVENKELFKKLDMHLLSSYNNFVARNLHVFQKYPHLVFQQALNEPPNSIIKLNLKSEDITSCVVECLSVSEHDPRLATLRGFVKNITAAICHKGKHLAFLGSEDGYLKVLDFSSKQIVRSVKSHSSAITYICIAGENRICTASTDTTLSIWSTVDYTRISILKGHKHNVSCCCTDFSNSILLSSAWDNTVRLWSLRDGRSISVIDAFSCPVNCLDHHPSKQQVACGLWNGNIEIWDTISLSKILILSSDYCSVKTITYTPDGINIISSYMNSDVVVWSSEQGLKISNLKGHALPVKSISYSLSSDIIISGSDDCTLKVWPSESGLSIHTISSCKFCPINLMEIISPNFLAVAFQNSEIWVIDMNKGFISSKVALQSDIVSCISKISSSNFPKDDTVSNFSDMSLVLGTQGGKVLILDLLNSSLSSIGSIGSRITSITHNKRIIVCANSDGDIGVFTSSETNSKIVYAAHRGSVTVLNLFVKNEQLFLVSAANDKVLKLWMIDFDNLDNPEVILNCESFSKHKEYVTCCCWFSNSLNENIDLGNLITGSHDNNVILQESGIETVFFGLKTSVVAVDFTDDFCVLGCGSDGSIAKWSKDGKLLSYVSGIEQSSTILSFHIDKGMCNNLDITLAFADKDGSVKIRKPFERSYMYSLEGHSKAITSCCSNQNGEVISSSLDGTVNIWKLFFNIQDIHLNHSALVTDIKLSMSYNIAISSDGDGSIVLWELDLSSTSLPLKYGTKKTFTGGFIKGLSWLQDRNFVCAVTQTIGHEELYFLEILSFELTSSDNRTVYNLQSSVSHHFESEILCLDSNPKTGTIVVGLKSGDFIVITANLKKTFSISEDWVLGAKIVQNEDTTEYLFCLLLNGSIKLFKTSEILEMSVSAENSFNVLQPSNRDKNSPYTSSFFCPDENYFFCGDTQGWLRVYSKNILIFSKKIHDDTLTGISVVGNYVFTCSLDRSLKGWNPTTLEQVCQFNSSIPITCLVVHEIDDCSYSAYDSYLMMIGTTSGALQILKFHDTQNDLILNTQQY